MNKNLQSFISIVSALFATLLFGICSLWLLKQFSYQGTSGKLRMLFVLTYTLILTASGWLYFVIKLRLVGFIHALLMLGIAGFGFYGGIIGMQTPLADNPSAGILASATVISFVFGGLTAICGIAVMLFTFKKTQSEK